MENAATRIAAISLACVILAMCGCASTAAQRNASRNVHMHPTKARELRKQAEGGTSRAEEYHGGMPDHARVIATRDKYRAYPLAPTIDPKNPNVVLASHFVYVKEEEGAPLLLPTSAVIVSADDANTPSDVAYAPARMNIELSSELARQREINMRLSQYQLVSAGNAVRLAESSKKLDERAADLEALVSEQAKFIKLLMEQSATKGKPKQEVDSDPVPQIPTRK